MYVNMVYIKKKLDVCSVTSHSFSFLKDHYNFVTGNIFNCSFVFGPRVAARILGLNLCREPGFWCHRTCVTGRVDFYCVVFSFIIYYFTTLEKVVYTILCRFQKYYVILETTSCESSFYIMTDAQLVFHLFYPQ